MLTILIGKSSSGKDTLLNKLVSEYGYIPLISTTSRPIRKGETEGKEYNFISKGEFENKISKNDFLEYRSYNTLVNGVPDVWYYGSPKLNLDNDKNYIVILDVDGAKSFLEYYKDKTEMKVYYISVNDFIREERAKKRGSFDKTEWDRRCLDDNIKFSKDRLALVNAKIVQNENISIEDLIKYIKEDKYA